MRTLPTLAGLAAAAVLLPAAAAPAATTWTTPQSFAVGKDYEPVPRAAIASDGTSALAFISKSGKLMLSTGKVSGRFTAPRPIDQKGVIDWSVAARRGGGFVVAWEDTDGIRVAVRTATGAKTVVRRVATSNGEEINGVQVAADPLGGWVIAERQFRKSAKNYYYARVMTLTTSGHRQGAVQDLGVGEFGIDARPTQSLAVDDTGRAVFAFEPEADISIEHPATALVTTRPHGGTFATPVALSGGQAGDARVAVGDGGLAQVAATQITSNGDAGIFGYPVVASISSVGALGAPAGPAVSTPNRAFAPSSAFTSSGRSVLVFQLKATSQPFETRAPVRAVAIAANGAVGKLQTLTSGQAKEPVVMPISGGRALTVWSGAKGLGASLAGPSGIFKKTAEPKGPPPPPFHTNSTNRDLRTAGRYAIFAWSRDADGRVRVAVRRF
jgi:hypothetical protein